MFVSMNVMNINNGSTSGHVDDSNVMEEEGQPQSPSRLANETTLSGKFENQQCVEGDSERVGRKRKTRRFKSRHKGKSSASKFKYLKKMRTTFRMNPQPEAPYNTNQFLMAEHTIENLDDTLSREKRHRECSLTSGDSCDEQFYSSPEDEAEFQTRDFDNAYQSTQPDLTKAELFEKLSELQAKVDELNKKLVTSSRLEELSNMLQINVPINNDKFWTEINDIILENQRLRKENEELQLGVGPKSSSSSSSSSSSEGGSENEQKMESDEKYRIDQRAAG